MRAFACDVPDCLCHYQKYLRNNKHRGSSKNIAGRSHDQHHPVRQRVEVWMSTVPGLDALPAGPLRICGRCESQARVQVLRELEAAPPDSPGDNTRAKHTKIRKQAQVAGSFRPWPGCSRVYFHWV